VDISPGAGALLCREARHQPETEEGGGRAAASMNRGGGGAEGGASWREEGGRRSAHVRELEGTATGACMSRGSRRSRGWRGRSRGSSRGNERTREPGKKGKREKGRLFDMKTTLFCLFLLPCWMLQSLTGDYSMLTKT